MCSVRCTSIFRRPLKKGREYAIDFFYSGNPTETGRFGGIAFKTDAAGKPWINTACQHVGASVWWPNKDQYRDEVKSMRLSVAVPTDLVDVSNGRFLGKKDLGDGYTEWNWQIHYPINNYSVSLNIGDYTHFTGRAAGQVLDFYVLPGRPREGEAAVPAGRRHDGRFREVHRRRIRSRRTATSWSRCRIPAWSTRVPSPTATGSPTATSSATGRASASARNSTSSSSTKAPTSGSATPSPRPTCRTSGFTKRGRPMPRASTSSTCGGRTTRSRT